MSRLAQERSAKDAAPAEEGEGEEDSLLGGGDGGDGGDSGGTKE